MKALIRLYFMAWWRSFVGPFFSLGFPLIMLFLLGQFIPYSSFAPTYLAYCAITLGVQSLSISLVQFRNSSLIKRIGQTPITRKQFIFSIITFNFVLIIIASLVTLFGMYLFQQLGIVKLEHFVQVVQVEGGKTSFVNKAISSSIIWSNIQILNVIVLQLVASFFSIALGIWLGTICSTAEKASGLGLTFYFILSFLSGIFFPLKQIQGAKALDSMSRAIPMRPVSEGLRDAFAGNFSWTDQAILTREVVGGEITKTLMIGPNWAWILYPIALGALLIIHSVIKFSWE